MALPDFLTTSTALLARRRLSGQARMFEITGIWHRDYRAPGPVKDEAAP